MKVIAFCSFKGGTGKTTLSMNVACYFSEIKNSKVLLIDMDPQSNLTSYVGECLSECSRSVSDLIGGVGSVSSLSKRTRIKNLDIITSNVSAEIFRESQVRDIHTYGCVRSILKCDANEEYDFCVIDTPPSLGALVRESVFASDEIVICLNPEPFSIVGLHKMKEFLQTESLLGKVSGVAISFWDPRNATNSLYVSNIESSFEIEIPIFKVRKDVSFSRSILKESSVFASYPKSRASSDVVEISEYLYNRRSSNDVLQTI